MPDILEINSKTYAFDVTAVSDSFDMSTELGNGFSFVTVHNPGTEVAFVYTEATGDTAVFPVDGTPQTGTIIGAGDTQVLKLDTLSHTHFYGITGSGALTLYVKPGKGV